MSDPKRANLITVGAPKTAKKNVTKTVRLTINLDESNESKYSELNYKELVIAEDKKKKVVVNGKPPGLGPYSDNDEDVQMVAKKFEQKYGGKSTYGKKGRSKHDDFADIGAGYDENDSFIDNTDGYDEMIPPECDTLYGGFYINCGSLEFKSVPNNQAAFSDTEPNGNKRNKRRISSSSSSEESSDSSSSESLQGKEKPPVNGIVNNHDTEHRRKKNKKPDKNKPKKIRRTDSSAAHSGKLTSDDNNQCSAESADSRLSQSDSLASKPARGSETAATSDSSRDIENKEAPPLQLPAPVAASLEELRSIARRTDSANSAHLDPAIENCLIRMERALAVSGAAAGVRRGAWGAAGAALRVSRARLLRRLAALSRRANNNHKAPAQSISTNNTHNKRKPPAHEEEDFSALSPDEREAKLVETIQKLKELIDERQPAMIANYKAECDRVQEERKKLQTLGSKGGAMEKRLPKRRFPWCGGARALLARVVRLAGGAAAPLLAARVLPLFPPGFVRMPTLLRQADLNKDIKGLETKRQRKVSSSQAAASSQPVIPAPTPPSIPLPDPIQFPSSLTVTTTTKPMEKPQQESTTPVDNKNPTEKFKSESVFGSILNSFTMGKELILEPEKKREESKKDDLYVPPNNIGSITITPVPNQVKEKIKMDKHKEGFIRVKSPAALNEMVKRDNNKKKPEVSKDTPLHIDTNFQTVKTNPSPNNKKDPQITKKQIESMRIAENNIPRPALIPVQHSPTFAKPDKRPPEVKKKKDILIVSDVDPLSDINQEPLTVDDSSSDIEVIEEKPDRIDVNSEVKSNSVPCKVSEGKADSVKDDKKSDDRDDHMDIDMVMRNLYEMEKRTTKHLEQSQREFEVSKMNSNSHSSSNSVKCDSSVNARGQFGDHRSDKDKFTELTSSSRMDGCNHITDNTFPQ